MTSAAYLPEHGKGSANNDEAPVTVSFSPEAVQQLRELTGEKDTRKALSKVFETVAYLKRQSDKGNKILIANKEDGSLQGLSFNN